MNLDGGGLGVRVMFANFDGRGAAWWKCVGRCCGFRDSDRYVEAAVTVIATLVDATIDPIRLTHQAVDALASRPPELIDRGLHAVKGKSAAVQVFGLDPSLQPSRVDANITAAGPTNAEQWTFCGGPYITA